MLAREPEWSISSGSRPFHPKPTLALGDLFAMGVTNFPDRAAISDGKQTLTFRELDELAWRISAKLREMGTSQGERIAVISSKSALMPAIVVAIWKCGATYVPLDQDAPEKRQLRLIARIAPRAVICCERDVLLDSVPVITVEELTNLISAPDCERWELPHMDPNDLAYIIFTSGSTGEPKGVEITVSNLLVYFRVHNRVLEFEQNSRVISFAPFHFDVSIEDTLLPLSLGAFSWQYREMYVGVLIRKRIAEQRITHMIAVSTILSLITTPVEAISFNTFPYLQLLMTGAEVCDPKVINHWVSTHPNLHVFNAYGPTEATIVCLCHQITYIDPERTEAFPIGSPLEQVSLLLLDEEGSESSSGELCIGGPLVMRGYLDRPDLTDRVIFERDGIRYYRSGDYCTCLPDGTFQYLGRRDDEVKINGRRIHLGELRQTAMSCSGIDRVVVGLIMRFEKSEIALLVFTESPEAFSDLRKQLGDRLPSYMLPSIWAHGTQVFQSASGKTDEKTLLERLRIVANQFQQTDFYLKEDGYFAPQARSNH
tara:strand:- start:2729 stop:4351 length:1623 start_codon:yes stop_codon:yes gene_type:complete